MRRVRTTATTVPLHIFGPGRLSGCARIRFVIAADGRAREARFEHFEPNAVFGRAALGQLEATQFTPSTGGGDAALIMFAFSMERDKEASASALR